MKALSLILSSPACLEPSVEYKARGGSQRVERQRDAKQTAAEENFMAHPDVQRLMGQQGAKLVPDSIRPFED